MNEKTQRRLMGVGRLMVGVLALIVVPLYFLYDGPPPAWNTLTRTLLSLPMLVAIIFFLTGLRQVLSRGGERDWLGTIAFGAGMTYVAVTLVAESMEAGVPLYAPNENLDPTIHGPLAAGMVLLHGPIARILTVVLLVSVGYAVRRSGVLPGWVGTSAYVIAVANLAFIPSLYFGMNPANFYAANGWGSTASISSVLLYWMMAVGISQLRAARTPSPVLDTKVLAATR